MVPMGSPDILEQFSAWIIATEIIGSAYSGLRGEQLDVTVPCYGHVRVRSSKNDSCLCSRATMGQNDLRQIVDALRLRQASTDLDNVVSSSWCVVCTASVRARTSRYAEKNPVGLTIDLALSIGLALRFTHICGL